VPALPEGVTTIDVTCRPEADRWACAVTLSDERGRSVHQVGVARRDLERLAPGAASPDDLVRRSFEFLLDREPRQSILASFELPLIGRYFPEYEATMIESDV
jgi:hypothetical protein